MVSKEGFQASQVSSGWISMFIEEYAPNVLIAATHGDLDDEAIVNAELREWCITNQVELVDTSAKTALLSADEGEPPLPIHCS